MACLSMRLSCQPGQQLIIPLLTDGKGGDAGVDAYVSP